MRLDLVRPARGQNQKGSRQGESEVDRTAGSNRFAAGSPQRHYMPSKAETGCPRRLCRFPPTAIVAVAAPQSVDRYCSKVDR